VQQQLRKQVIIAAVRQAGLLPMTAAAEVQQGLHQALWKDVTQHHQLQLLVAWMLMLLLMK
jgi:hypothetical protein